MNFELLKTILETPGVSGQEGPIRSLVAAELRKVADGVSVDAMGNVIAVKHGKPDAPRVLVAAHMDEIGFMVKHVDDHGFVRLQPLGGFDARNLVAQRVYVHGFTGEHLLGALMPAAKPIHMLSAEDANKPPKIDELFVDLGMTADEVKKVVEIGDAVTLARTAERIGSCVLSKSMDNRVSVFVLLEALRALGDHACEILAAATVQEEVGLRGAGTAAYSLKPEVAVAIDTTLANDFPGPSEHEAITKLGQGAAIKIMDSSLLCHPKLVRHFRDVAEKNGIKHQMEILPRGGTDAGAMQRSRGGVPSITISIPTRYVHTVNEVSSVADIEAAIELLARFLEDAHTRTYGYEGDLA